MYDLQSSYILGNASSHVLAICNVYFFLSMRSLVLSEFSTTTNQCHNHLKNNKFSSV